MCILTVVCNNNGVGILSLRQAWQYARPETPLSLLKTLAINGKTYDLEGESKTWYYAALDPVGWWIASMIAVPKSDHDNERTFSITVVQNGEPLQTLPNIAQKTTRWVLPVLVTLYSKDLLSALWNMVFDSFYLHKFDIKVTPSNMVGIKHGIRQSHSDQNWYTIQSNTTDWETIWGLRGWRVFMSYTLWLLEHAKREELERRLWEITTSGPSMVDNMEAVLRWYGLLWIYSTEPIWWSELFGPMSYTGMRVKRDWERGIEYKSFV